MGIARHEVNQRMSQAVVHGGLVYLAGQVADEPKGRSTAEQAADILGKIDRLLAQAGTDKSRLLQAQVWLIDMGDFQAFNTVWDNWVAPGNPPARACVQAPLARPEFRVEVMVIAAI